MLLEDIETQVADLQSILDNVCKRAGELTLLRDKLAGKSPDDLEPISSAEVDVMIPVSALMAAKTNEVVVAQNKASESLTKLYQQLEMLIDNRAEPSLKINLPQTQDTELAEAVKQAALDRLAERSVDAK